jgi:hypothetical protein
MFTITYNYTTAAGCTASAKDSILVALPPPIPSISRNGDVLSASVAGLAYQWYLNGAPVSNATNQQHTMTQTGIYNVRMTNPAGCSSVSADFSSIMTGLNSLLTGATFTLFPNPSKDRVNLSFVVSNPADLNITIVDALGRTAWRGLVRGDKGENRQQLRYGTLTPGNYMIKVDGGGLAVRRGIVVE